MAENESPGLGASYSQRWDKPFEGIRKQLPPAFARQLISTEVLSRGQSQEDVIELLARYRNEWMTIASDKREKGYNWARLLAMHEPKMEGLTHASARND